MKLLELLSRLTVYLWWIVEGRRTTKVDYLDPTPHYNKDHE